jgi:hypothetical protein
MLASAGRLSLLRKLYFVRSRPQLRVAAVSCLVFCLFSARFAGATPADLVGPGPESTALAGAGVSLELGPEAAVLNPAGLARLRAKQVLLGYRASRFALDFARDGRAEPISAELAEGLFVGVAAPFGNEEVRAALGLYAETPPDFIVRADLPRAGEAFFPLLVGRAQALDLGAGLAGGVGPLSFGAGVRVLAALSSRVNVAQADGVAASGLANELLPTWAPSAGLVLDLGDIGAVGLSLRGVLRADFDVDVAAPTLGGIAIAPLNVAGVAHYEPFRAELELSRRFGALTLALGLRYERWSDFPGWLGPTVDCPARRARCGTPVPPPPGYSDVFVPHVAASRAIAIAGVNAELRAGYSYVPSPLPDQTVDTSLDPARHGFALGYGLSPFGVRLPLHLDAAFRFDWLPARVTRGEAGSSRLRASGSMLTWSLGAGVEL